MFPRIPPLLGESSPSFFPPNRPYNRKCLWPCPALRLPL
uniref:Uncharacterized protein n=1 Tax=Lotus japonicus TaxID=34305 RepID=I3SY14_LOTJA|nr:unknown [Lotus japonicus]